MEPGAPARLRALLDRQHGVIARWQARAAGLDPRLIEARLRRGRRQPMYRGVYPAFTGPPARPAVLWAALLRAGPGAALSHWTAAEQDQLTGQLSAAIHVTVTSARRVVITEYGPHTPRIMVHYSERVLAHPARAPAGPGSRRPPSISPRCPAPPKKRCPGPSGPAPAGSRPPVCWPLPWRAAPGCAGAANWPGRWLNHAAECIHCPNPGMCAGSSGRTACRRPHGLPPAARPAAGRPARSRAGGRTRYLDGLYQEHGVAVELDGRADHPAEARWRDIRRDNVSAAAGIITLRYSRGDVTDEPCRVAAEIAAVLQQRGWRGQPRRCGPGLPGLAMILKEFTSTIGDHAKSEHVRPATSRKLVIEWTTELPHRGRG